MDVYPKANTHAAPTGDMILALQQIIKKMRLNRGTAELFRAADARRARLSQRLWTSGRPPKERKMMQSHGGPETHGAPRG
ncbi:hypothetical protein EYF80_057125 [Liparis tanakae]|uniref:Uncharacterized protein n=1 Tax=Liparis tanakae TaxID=230148 RepID=A0A4Z2EWT6_9TELE|nr:hypothetical protein EYF80_057125 [Liparis tanakae]